MTQAAILAASGSSGTTTGFKNRIINGAMEINQRGSSSYTTNGYTLDRWTLFNSGGTFAASQQTYASASQPAFGLKNFLRVTRSSPSSILYITQKIEDVSYYDNVTVTVSFYARATGAVTLPTRVMQEFGSGGSASVTVGSVSHSLTTTTQRFTATYNCPSLAGKTIGTSSYLELTFDTPATTETIEISGVQLEVGTTATNFDFRSYGTELALCQRYFQIVPFTGIAANTSELGLCAPFKVTMRANPSVNTVLRRGPDYTQLPDNQIDNWGVAVFNTSGVAFSAGFQGTNALMQMGISSVVAGRIYGGSTQVSAEL